MIGEMVMTVIGEQYVHTLADNFIFLLFNYEAMDRAF